MFKNNIPNILTITRIFLLLPIIYLFIINHNQTDNFSNKTSFIINFIIFLLILLSAITDFLDGYIARKYNMGSDLGAILDPIADKIFVSTIILLLIYIGYFKNFNIIAPIIILSREFAIASLRDFLSSKSIKLPVSNLGKWKTTFQLSAIILASSAPLFFSYQSIINDIGLLAFWLAAIISLISMVDYFKIAFKNLSSINNDKATK